MAKNTHKTSSKTAKKPGQITKPHLNHAGKNGNQSVQRLEKANAHLLKAWRIMHEIRIGKRKAKEPSLKWLKSLMTRTSL